VRTTPPKEAEFLRLVEENQPRIARLCRVYAWNAADQEDLAQEIMAQVWRALPTLREPAHANTWLYRIALNTAISFGRKQKSRWRAAEANEAQVRQWTENRPALAASESSPRLESLYEAMDRLDKIEKALITLYLEDLSYDAMAEVMGLSASHVGVMLHRTKKKLFGLMSQEAAP
jgi:RNA polymerase sigma-70 factor (ECF subfamily)